MLPICPREFPAALNLGEGAPVFLTGIIILFKMIATDGRTKNGSDPVLAYQNEVSPDWEPDENPAHHVYARSAAMSARYQRAQRLEYSTGDPDADVASSNVHFAGVFSVSRTKPGGSFSKSECPASNSS